jgi:hypothetical protein
MSGSSSAKPDPVIGKTQTEPTKETGNKPPKFMGNRDEYQNFMSKMKIHLALNEEKYSTPAKKILGFISYLDGEAGEWSRMWIDARPPTSETNSTPAYGTYEDFITAFNENYKPTDTRQTAMDQLDSLKQGSLPANEFVTKFKLLA